MQSHPRTGLEDSFNRDLTELFLVKVLKYTELKNIRKIVKSGSMLTRVDIQYSKRVNLQNTPKRLQKHLEKETFFSENFNLRVCFCRNATNHKAAIFSKFTRLFNK